MITRGQGLVKEHFGGLHNPIFNAPEVAYLKNQGPFNKSGQLIINP